MKNNLVFLDFDDTLCISGIHFWRAYIEFLNFFYEKIDKVKHEVQPYYVIPTITDIIKFIEKEEAKNINQFGYTPLRMENSFFTVLESYILNAYISVEDIETLKKITKKPFDAELTLFPGAMDAIEELKRIADIHIWTRGSQSIQELRVISVGIDINEIPVHASGRKSKETMLDLKNRLTIEKSYDYTWMVGNSLDHDILPAIQNDIKAILIGKDTETSMFKSFHIVRSFPEAVDAILEYNLNPSDLEETML